MFPSEDRLNGKHIIDYAKTKTGKQFSKTEDIENMTQMFNDLKNKIKG